MSSIVESPSIQAHPAKPDRHATRLGSDEATVENPEDAEKSSQSQDPYIVDWDGPDDPKNPKNWDLKKKWLVTILISAYAFMSPVSSSIMAPAEDQAAARFSVSSSAVKAMLTSSFVAAYALGTLIIGPLSELFGRARVLQLANMWYLVWNFGCAFAQNEGQMIAFRFLAGFGGSGAQTVGGAVIGDVWYPEQRGNAIAAYNFATFVGPVIGPICGAWIAEKTTWQWVFWSTSILDGAIQGVGIVFLRETYAPVLLDRKACGIRKNAQTNSGVGSLEIRTVFDGPDRQWRNLVQKALVRPFLFLLREPIIQLFGAYMAFVYGTMYVFLTTMPMIFQGVYGESIGIAGLHYLALGIGMTSLSQLNARYLDVIYKYLKDKYGGVGKPEYRLPPMVPGTFLLPIGLLITGWTARPNIHWIVPDVGIVIIGAGLGLNFQTITMYVIDAFDLHAASALAAVLFVRSLAAFGMPLFAPAMYTTLGSGRGNTILACAAIAIGIPAPFLFWRFGEQIRTASRYARHA